MCFVYRRFYYIYFNMKGLCGIVFVVNGDLFVVGWGFDFVYWVDDVGRFREEVLCCYDGICSL